LGPLQPPGLSGTGVPGNHNPELAFKFQVPNGRRLTGAARSTCGPPKFLRRGERNRLRRVVDIGSPRGGRWHQRPVVMPRSALTSLDRTKLPLSLAAGLQAAFADIASSPL